MSTTLSGVPYSAITLDIEQRLLPVENKVYVELLTLKYHKFGVLPHKFNNLHLDINYMVIILWWLISLL